jgi:glutaredoxin-related protein
MSKVISSIFITTVLLGLSTPVLAQECINCWMNPKTGKIESLDQSTNATPPSGSTNQSAQRNVIVYGRRTCGLTTRMMQQLDANHISYQFKNVDDRTVNIEMWSQLRSTGIATTNAIRLPVLSVKGKTMVNATIKDVQVALR